MPSRCIASARYGIRERDVQRDKCSSAWIIPSALIDIIYVLTVALGTEWLKKIHGFFTLSARAVVLRFFVEYYPIWVECSNLRVKLETQSPETWPDYQVRFMFTSITKRILILARSNIGFPSDKRHDVVFNNGFGKSWRNLAKTFFFHAVRVLPLIFINVSFGSGIKICLNRAALTTSH